MQIYISQNGKQLGPFTEEELRAQLTSGTILPQDLAWWEGQAAWTPLAQTPYATSLSTSPLPPPIGVPVTPFGGVRSMATTSIGGRTSGLAIASLITGIAFVFCTLLFFIPVILGHLALSEIKKNPGMQGHGMALAGTILGYVQIVILGGSILFFFMLKSSVKDTFNTINEQIQQAEKDGTNSTTTPATNGAPSTNAATSTDDQIKEVFKTIHAQLEKAQEDSTNSAANPAPNTSSNSSSAPDTSTNSAPATTNAPPSSDGH